MVKGSLADFFKGNRGIQQGEPLSPYIFLSARKYWSIQMDLSPALVRIQPIKKDMRNLVEICLVFK